MPPIHYLELQTTYPAAFQTYISTYMSHRNLKVSMSQTELIIFTHLPQTFSSTRVPFSECIVPLPTKVPKLEAVICHLWSSVSHSIVNRALIKKSRRRELLLSLWEPVLCFSCLLLVSLHLVITASAKEPCMCTGCCQHFTVKLIS